MVSITIIMILIGLLFPVFTKAKYAAEETVCISNVQQIWMALQMYKTDYDEYPAVLQDSPALKPYFGGTELKCPVARSKPPKLRYPQGDYKIMTPPPILPVYPDDIKQNLRVWAECSELRGPEFPIVLDLNHLSTVERAERGTAFVILARDDGSAHKVVDRTREFLSGVQSPCDPDLTYLNL